MTGTEKIKAKILEDAKNKAFEIEEQARQEARSITDQALKEAEIKKAEILKKAEAEGQEVYRRLISVAGLEARKEILKAKQDMVEEAFAKAVEKITGLPDTDYQKMLEEMVAGAASDGTGEILLSERDIKRVDKNFADNINRHVKTAGKNGELVLSNENIQTAGGFVLRYGDMEINGTFEIVFDMLRPQIENDVVNILFS
jgi:V/A-type H+-transporting ATPase subunit E